MLLHRWSGILPHRLGHAMGSLRLPDVWIALPAPKPAMAGQERSGRGSYRHFGQYSSPGRHAGPSGTGRVGRDHHCLGCRTPGRSWLAEVRVQWHVAPHHGRLQRSSLATDEWCQRHDILYCLRVSDGRSIRQRQPACLWCAIRPLHHLHQHHLLLHRQNRSTAVADIWGTSHGLLSFRGGRLSFIRHICSYWRQWQPERGDQGHWTRSKHHHRFLLPVDHRLRPHSRARGVGVRRRSVVS